MNDKAPATARRARIARRLRVDRNPLRRPVDRLQAGIMAGLLAAFLAVAPLAAAAASGWAHAAGLREQHAQRSWHQVPAVLLQAAPPQAAFRHWTPGTWARGRWTPPGGPARAGTVPAPPGARADSRVRVWADRTGPVAGTPLTSDEITARASAAAMLAVACLAIAVAGLARAARWLLDRRRLAAWAADWDSTGPHWTRHR